jgi:hypothetical protein
MINNNQNTIVPEETIEAKIYLLRGQKVMLDKDLADLYGVKPIRLREQVKRNLDRFPEKFMFQLNKKEVDHMVSQNAIPSKQQLGGYLPYAFSEYGVLMLANVLKSSRAIQMSIRIIEVFLKMREMIMTYKDMLLQLEILERSVEQNSDDIHLIFKTLRQILEPPKVQRRQIGFKRSDEINP